MEADLTEALAAAKNNRIKIEDICFSGNGEPSQSQYFPAALETAFRIREKEAPEAELVLITNGAGLLNEETFELLRRSAINERLKIWLKLDAGTKNWYQAMNRSAIPYEDLIEKIRSFVKCAPVILQTMICAIDGSVPPPDEKEAWEALMLDLASSSAELIKVQIYGKARPAPDDPASEAVSEAFLEERAASIRKAIARTGKNVPVLVYP